MGGVEPPSQPNLHHGDIDSLTSEIDEGHEGDELKKGQRNVGRQSASPHFFRQRYNFVWRDLLVADPDALGKRYQVGRGVKRRSVTSQAKYAVKHRRGRAFAVGPSDVKRRKGFFRMVEERERPFHAV